MKAQLSGSKSSIHKYPPFDITQVISCLKSIGDQSNTFCVITSPQHFGGIIFLLQYVCRLVYLCLFVNLQNECTDLNIVFTRWKLSFLVKSLVLMTFSERARWQCTKNVNQADQHTAQSHKPSHTKNTYNIQHTHTHTHTHTHIKHTHNYTTHIHTQLHTHTTYNTHTHNSHNIQHTYTHIHTHREILFDM